ncbi:MAG: cytochrome C oxidase subunit IV family protein [Opitutaceae bacterium]|jgi:cytochrome c oxidase subunit 4
MSATAAPAHATDRHAPGESKFHIFVQLAMILSVITGVEIIMVYLPFAHWLLFATLAVLSAVKFLCVIFLFMHLRWDKMFCTVLFFIGLILAGGTMWALLQIFSADASKPLSMNDRLHEPVGVVQAA